MTIPEFIKAIEGYYGKYKPATKSVVIQYLQEESVYPERLRAIWRHLVKTVSGQYGFVPDVATIEQAKKDAAKEYATKQLEYKPAEPEQEAQDFHEELGGLLKKLVEKFSLRRQREREEV